jgi:hypothetical protein
MLEKSVRGWLCYLSTKKSRHDTKKRIKNRKKALHNTQKMVYFPCHEITIHSIRYHHPYALTSWILRHWFDVHTRIV